MRCWCGYRLQVLLAAALVALSTGVNAQEEEREEPDLSIEVGEYPAEVRKTYTTDDGLPSNDVYSIAIHEDGSVYAATAAGVARFADGKWTALTDPETATKLITVGYLGVLATTETTVLRVLEGKSELVTLLPDDVTGPESLRDLQKTHRSVLLATSAGLFDVAGSKARAVELNSLLGDNRNVRQIAASPAGGYTVVAADAGLFRSLGMGEWQKLEPRSGDRSWASSQFRGAAYDSDGHLWFACAQGVGRLDETGWTLYTGREGLPYNDFTTVAGGPDGAMWFGTSRGAIRFDDGRFEYRQAPRWLPHDVVRDIAVDGEGRAWFATEEGVGVIEHQPMTLAEKAKIFEEDIDKYHRRTPYGYVLSVRLKEPGDRSEWTQHDSDNDGLWTGMYGAGECFAYAATGDPAAKERATAAFEALRFLSQVTQGGSHPAPPGFPARSILPTSGEDPNAERYTPEKDREKQKRDPLWKVISPRWPTSEDGKWYWKTDTSSDELDGHFFLYANYYDLVAETEEEKQRCRDVVVAITDHLLEHDYDLVDHDGKPTRWARFGPQLFNRNFYWAGERGLNSLSILSYLKVAEHISGDSKYGEAYNDLVENHGYAINAMVPKVHIGQGTGNQSDDEMAFMCFYNLIRYEDDPELRRGYAYSLRRYWQLEEPELNPLFNFIFAASMQELSEGGDPRLRRIARVPSSAIEESADTLKRFPLDRIRWSFDHSHRLDVELLSTSFWRREAQGHRVTGDVIPIDERSVAYWNHDPWQLEEDHDGRTLTDGAAFLLPYYMGLYHGFIVR